MLIRKLLSFLSLGILVVLSACARPVAKTPQYSQPILDSSYVVYQLQEGKASWYGPGFYGRKTASGERFQKNKLTCAHRNLPFGTRLQVTNLENGKQIEVVVNDRGPFIYSRILDLSYAAAKELDIIHPGEAKVQVRYLIEGNPLLAKDLSSQKEAISNN